MAKFLNGDVVSLNSHPFFNYHSESLIAANDDLISPVMVVTEILLGDSLKPLFDPKTGIGGISKTQIKCVFYSHKNHKYATNWFNEGQLKQLVINEDVRLINISKLQDVNKYLEKNVILKTWKVEIIKKKISLSYNSNSEDKSSKINALMSFLPPVMTVIGCKKSEEQPGNFDKKTGSSKRCFSNFLIKCKWYNPGDGNFSEDFFSTDSIEIVPEVNAELIAILQKAILNKKYLQFINKDICFNDGKTIGLPLEIIFNHCYYKLSYFDYLTNKIHTINIQDYSIKEFTVKDLYFKDIIPKFLEIELKSDVNDFLLKEFPSPFGRAKKYILRITYLSKSEEKTTRTISSVKMFYNGDKNDFTKKKERDEYKYLEAICFRRNGEKRYFKFDRIKKIEILDL